LRVLLLLLLLRPLHCLLLRVLLLRPLHCLLLRLGLLPRRLICHLETLSVLIAQGVERQ
jgi:hypothetical protein